MNKKAEITLGGIISVVVISLVVFVSLIMPMIQNNDTYGVNQNDSTYSERLDNYQANIATLERQSEEFKSSSENVNGTPSTVDILGFMFKSGWTAAKTSVTMTAESTELARDVSEDVGVPSYVYSAVITLVFVTIGFALVVLALGRK